MATWQPCLRPPAAGDPSWPKPDVLHTGQHPKVQENGAGIESQVRHQHKQQYIVLARVERISNRSFPQFCW